jgi:hypothetical protein
MSSVAGLVQGDISSLVINQGATPDGIVLTRDGNSMIGTNRHEIERAQRARDHYRELIDPNATDEQRLWTRIHMRRAGIEWPEQELLKKASVEVLAECGDKMRAEIVALELEVAALLAERGLER